MDAFLEKAFDQGVPFAILCFACFLIYRAFGLFAPAISKWFEAAANKVNKQADAAQQTGNAMPVLAKNLEKLTEGQASIRARGVKNSEALDKTMETCDATMRLCQATLKEQRAQHVETMEGQRQIIDKLEKMEG